MKLYLPYFLSMILSQNTQNNDRKYNEFPDRIREEQPYTGFFTTEWKCKHDIHAKYLAARSEFFKKN